MFNKKRILDRFDQIVESIDFSLKIVVLQIK